MFIELIDLLRCTRAHEESWLVATFHELRDRVVIEGMLSCPVCGARYPVTKGVAYFDVPAEQTAARGSAPAEDRSRVAAYLNLVEPGIVVLAGEWGSASTAIATLGNTVIAFNVPNAREPFASCIRSDGMLPLARESVDGVALDSTDAVTIESGAGALKAGARMVAPAAAAVPAGLTELARDERYWVAVRGGGGVSGPVQIARGTVKNRDG